MRGTETILISGAGPNGVTGRRIKEYLQKYYIVLSPSSKELDLRNQHSVDSFFNSHQIDYIVHSAVLAPSRGHDNSDVASEVENNLRMYFNLAAHSNEVKKMFYLGSGAEFDKSHSITDIKEERSLERIPKDKYGFIKYILNAHAQQSLNIYNIRIFGVINPYEPPLRNVVSQMCERIVLGEEIKLRRNCHFSFVDIDDVSRFIRFGIENDLEYHDYNMVGWNGEILEIANIIKGNDPSSSVYFESKGNNLDYYGNNERLLTTGFKTTPIEDSVRKVIQFFRDSKKM